MPGAISMTRTFSPLSSRRRVRASMCSPAFAALYPEPPGYASWAATEVTKSTSPRPLRRRAGSSALVTRRAPSTLVSYIRCHLPRSASATGSTPRAPPATWTTALSSSPNSSCVRSASAATDASSVTSTPRVAQPVSSASACSRSSRRATARTCQPSATRRRAVARPMPDEAPVTTAVRGVEGSVASWVLGEVMASQYAEHVPGCTTAAGAGAAAPLWSSAQVARLARVSTYRSVAAAAFRQYSTYRMATAAGVFTNVVFGFIRASILFAAIGGPGGELSGYTIAQAATYVWLGQPLLAPIEAFGTREVSQRVHQGDIAIDLLRPVSFLGLHYAQKLGRSGFLLLGRGIPPLLVGAV